MQKMKEAKTIRRHVVSVVSGTWLTRRRSLHKRPLEPTSNWTKLLNILVSVRRRFEDEPEHTFTSFHHVADALETNLFSSRTRASFSAVAGRIPVDLYILL